MSEGDKNRTCGTCYACCVALGIGELKKHTAVACKQLDGSNPVGHCSIYERRPLACREYLCAWRQGLFEDDFSPERVGFVVTAYEQGWSIMVTDTAKAGDIQTRGPVRAAVQRILQGEGRLANADIRIVYLKERRIVLLTEGEIFNGDLLRNEKGDYETLKFAVGDKPIGQYRFEQQTQHEKDEIA